MPRIVPRDFGTSLFFNGSSSKVTSSAQPFTSPFTITGWAKRIKDTGSGQAMISGSLSSSPMLRLNNASDQIVFWSNAALPNTTFSAAAIVAAGGGGYGKWFFYALSYDQVNATLYINGQLIASNAYSQAIDNSGFFQVGARNVSSDSFNGFLDAPVVYNKILNQQEINNIYYAGIRPANSSIVLSWKFNEGAGTLALDDSGNNNNGTLAGATYSNDVAYKLRSTGNLIVNGDFENAPSTNVPLVNRNKWLDGTALGADSRNAYQWYNDGSGTIRSAQFDNSTSNSGAYSLKLSVGGTSSYEEAKQVPGGYNTPPNFGFNLEPSTTYRVTYWMRTNYVSGDSNDGAFLQFHTALADGTNSSETNVGFKIKTTTPWTQYSFTITTSATQVRGHVQPRVYGQSGAATLVMDAWFDDITVTKVAPTGRINGRDNRVSANFTTASGGFRTSNVATSAGGWDGTTQLTGSFGVWFKLTQPTTGNFTMYTPGFDRVDLNYENGGKIFVFAYLAPANNQLVWKSNVSMVDSKWHHVFVNKTATAIDAWLDGVKVGSLATTALANNTNASYPNGANGNVAFSHLALWKRSLTDAEIQAVYMANTIPTTGLVHYIPFNEATGGVSYDTLSGRNDHALLTTANVWSSDSYVRGRQPGSGNIVHNGNFENIPPAYLYGTPVPNTGGNQRVIEGTGNSGASIDENTQYPASKIRYSWSFIAFGVTNPLITYDLAVKKSGLASMRFEGTQIKERVHTMWGARIYFDQNVVYDINNHDIPVLPNTTYDVSYWVKQNAANVVGTPEGADLVMSVHSNTGQVSNPKVAPPNPTGTFDWTFVTGSFTTPANARFLNLGFGLFGNASNYYDAVAWFDDLSITPRSTGRALIS